MTDTLNGDADYPRGDRPRALLPLTWNRVSTRVPDSPVGSGALHRSVKVAHYSDPRKGRTCKVWADEGLGIRHGRTA